MVGFRQVAEYLVIFCLNNTKTFKIVTLFKKFDAHNTFYTIF